MKYKIFTSEQIREICKIFVGSNYSLNEEGIKYILSSIKVNDYDPNSPKQNRLYNALLHEQKKTKDGGKILDFISTALNPDNYIDHRDIFTERINQINIILSSIGVKFSEDGKYNVITEHPILDKPSFIYFNYIKKYKIALFSIAGILLIAIIIITNIINETELSDNTTKQITDNSNISSKDIQTTQQNTENNVNSSKNSERERIISDINYILDVYPSEIDGKRKADEKRMGFTVHLRKPTWLVIKDKLIKEGFKRISDRDFDFDSYQSTFRRFKVILDKTQNGFFISNSYQNHTVIIAIAVANDNSGVKDREILIDGIKTTNTTSAPPPTSNTKQSVVEKKYKMKLGNMYLSSNNLAYADWEFTNNSSDYIDQVTFDVNYDVYSSVFKLNFKQIAPYSKVFAQHLFKSYAGNINLKEIENIELDLIRFMVNGKNQSDVKNNIEFDTNKYNRKIKIK